MEWIYFLIAAIIYLFASWMTYSDSAKQAAWYIPVGIFVGAVLSCLWYLAARLITVKEKMVAYSMAWDSMMMTIYYLMPLIFFGARLNAWGYFAMFMILSGIVILKMKC